MAETRSGLGYLRYGLTLIFKPKLRRFVYIPLLLNILIFIFLWYGSSHYFNMLVLKIDGYMPSWLQWLNSIFWILFSLLGILLTVYLFTLFGNLIGSPFYGLLSESVQLYLSNEPIPQTQWSELLADMGKALSRQWQIMGYYVPRALGLFILSFIPVVNLISWLLWFLFSAWMQTIQYVDYPMDNNLKSFKEARYILSNHKMDAFGFGIPVVILMMVPIVNIVIIPAAVAGATAMWMDKLKDQQKIS